MACDPERIAVGTCANCHGRRGHSIQPKFPVLAGQHADYLLAQYLMKQLRSFQNNLRDVAIVLGVAQGLKAPDMVAVSQYLESLGP